MKTDNLLTLPDGRKLAYAEFGKPEGHPVLYFHSSPGSRLDPMLLGDEVFNQYGLRIIAPDRPGMGSSDFQPNRGFSTWVKDVIFLTEALSLHQFSVLGVSGGGGYAAVCAAKIPGKLQKVVIASGAWQIDATALRNIGFPMNLQWQLARHAPIFLPLMLKTLFKMMSQPPKNDFDRNSVPPKKIMPAADHAAMTQPSRIAALQQTLGEVLKQGTRGPVWDMCLYVRQWDFDLSEIQVPLTLFHGEQDRNFPVELVRRMVKRLPRAELITFPDDGHVSTHINHFDEIAEALIADQQAVYQ